ncbi:MAG: sodium:calcium antiporter [Elusimicrobiota bacterium]|nr:sodium:calcium antiporter [Elusimicrobiota bacterium]
MIAFYLALTLICFIFVFKAADILVGSASIIAERFGIPPVFIGVVLVGLGTSAPEIFVTLAASLSSHPGIVLGNASGSIAANSGLAMAVIFWLYDRTWKMASPGDKNGIGTQFIVLNFVFLAAGSASMIFLFKNGISRQSGIIMLFLTGIYFYLTARINSRFFIPAETKSPVGVQFLRFCLSLAVLLASCKLIVFTASKVAQLAGVSEFIIGLTIIAVGTSLPEIATSLTAMKQGRPGLAVGDIVGSQALNLYLLLGLSAVTKPLAVGNSLFVFGWLFVFLGEICFFLWSKKIPARLKTAVLFITYCIYLLVNVGYMR